MGYISIISAQIIILGIVISARRATLLERVKQSAMAVAGLEIALVPVLLMLAETQAPKDLHPITVLVCLVTLIGGFALYGAGLRRP